VRDTIDEALEQIVGDNETCEVGVDIGKDDVVIVTIEDNVPPLFTETVAKADIDSCVDGVAVVDTVRELGIDFDVVRDAALESEGDTVGLDVTSALRVALSDKMALLVAEGEPDEEGDIDIVFTSVAIDVTEVDVVNES
jgi:hypothetical protein